jgi:penicillin amidase
MIEIVRDGNGVPHCYAGAELDAFFAQGWVHAADRRWQLEYDRRRATGAWGEVAGERAAAADAFYRAVDLPAAVRRDLQGLAPATRAMLEAYADGVNAWTEASARAGTLPREFAIAGVRPQPWAPWHSLLVYRVRHVLMGSARAKTWRATVARVLGDDVARTMYPGWGEDDIACVPPGARCDTARRVPVPAAGGAGDDAGGSNNWVLSGARTASGLPLLAGDPHRELEMPNVYVQGHVVCPEWDVLGFAIPGVPGFSHFGHNDRVAWSITHAMADDQDVLTAGGDGDGVRYELRWTATAAPNHGFDVIAPMLRARSVAELFETMRGWVEPVNNLLAADVEGTIGYLTRGRLPVRRRLDGVWLPVPAGDASHDWVGWVPFEQLPRCVDPPEGFLYSANNRIAASADAPYIGLDVTAPWRALRIVETLASTGGATVDHMAALHRDVVSLPARRLVERLRTAGGWPALDGWDGTMRASSTAAAAYSVLRRELLLLVLERSGLAAALDSPSNRILPGVVPESACWRAVDHHLHAGDTSLLGGWTWDDALAEAVARAEKAWSGETWGDLHRTAQRHALGDASLDPRHVAVDGDPDTVCSMGYTPTAGFAVRTGPVARYAFDVADWDRSGWAVPLGAGGSAGAPHAEDQLDAWAEGRLLPAPYTRPAVDAAATSTERVSRP